MNNRHLLWIFLLSIGTVLLYSNDSFLYDVSSHFDSAWFMQCGKWMMQGWIPYVDFADSKGPLLWLIYGLSSYLSPYTHLGVCVFSVISYFFAYFFSYKTIRLLCDSSQSMLGVILMAIIYWNPFFVSETRAEHFTFPVVSMSLYYLLKSIVQKESRFDFQNGLVVGCSVAISFLIKWSIGAMFFGFVLSFLFIAYKNNNLLRFFIGFFIGIALWLLPFCIYFYRVASIQVFVDEYVVNTSKTVSKPLFETLFIYCKEWIKLFLSRRIIFVLFLFVAYRYVVKVKSFSHAEVSLLMISGFGFLLIGIHTDDFMMYLTPMASFGVFSICALFVAFGKERLGVLKKIACCSLIAHSLFVVTVLRSSSLFCLNKEYRNDFYKAAYYFGQVEHPILLNFGNETGVGFPVSNVQPACKYWSRQRGSTNEMKQMQVDCLHQKKPDFVTLQFWVDNVTRKEIESYGYHFVAHFGYTDVFTKHDLKPAPEEHLVLDLDVLLKKDVRRILYGEEK